MLFRTFAVYIKLGDTTMRRPTVLVALLFLASASFGQDCPTATTYVDFNECFALLNQEEDKKLNFTYQALIRELNSRKDGNEVRALRAVQRKWLRDRGEACEKAGDEFNDGWRGAAVGECLLKWTRGRTTELVRLVNDVRSSSSSATVPSTTE